MSDDIAAVFSHDPYLVQTLRIPIQVSLLSQAQKSHTIACRPIIIHNFMEPFMAGTTWVYSPHSGGKKIPDRVKERIRQRILHHAAVHYAGKYVRIEVRFRAQFCYIDAYTEPYLSDDYDPVLAGETREDCIERMRRIPMPLCRLRHFGSDDSWSMDFYTYSHEKYEPSVFNDGNWTGTPEPAFDAASVYLTD